MRKVNNKHEQKILKTKFTIKNVNFLKVDI